MARDEKIFVPGPGMLRFERLLPASVERVWSYLTDSEKRGKWLASGPMDLHVGGKVELFLHHNSLTQVQEPIPPAYKAIENGVTMRGTIVRIEPPHLLSYTWGDGEKSSEVTFELAARGEQTLLTISHRNLANRDDTVGTATGWSTHTDVLTAVLTDVAPGPFWSTLERVRADYEQRIPFDTEPPRLSIKREFAASAERVFDSFLDARLAAQWMFTTPTGRIVRAEIDPRVGGGFVFTDRRDGEDFEHYGTWLEIVRPSRLVFTLRVPKFSPDDSRVTIDIVRKGNACELTLTHERYAAAMIDALRRGWTTILDDCAKTLGA